MCGILGEYNIGKKTEAGQFDSLLQLSNRRGPDASGVVETGNVIFGFNRLSILDTSDRGMQPIISPSGRYVVILNGEIYNYKDLQRQYNISSAALRSGSDVEVVSHLADVIDKSAIPALLNGMFALAIYDKESRELLLARDFAGIKPLFYGICEQGVAFASQFNQVYKHPFFERKLSVSASGIRDYLELGYMQDPSTVYEQIHQLKPGEMLTVNEQLLITKKVFAGYPSIVQGKLQNETDANTVSSFNELLHEVVKDQLVSDVPIGTFLSGGIDSSLIAAVAAKEKKDLAAFTFDVKDKELSELEQAKLYAGHLGIKHLTETLEADSILDMCNEHFAAYPEPFGDPSSLPTYIITKLARKHLTVLLSGDGGDELLWGYPRFAHIAENVHYYKYPHAIRKIYAGVERRMGKKVSYGITNFHNLGYMQLNKHIQIGYNTAAALFGNNKHSSVVEELYHYSGGKTKEEVLMWLRWNEYYAHMQRILIKVDRASMHNSLEVRVPYLDKRIVSFSWNTKPELGIKHDTLKYVLKEVMKYYYPEELIYKKKKGFSIPYHEYLTGDLRKDVEEQVLDSPLFGGDHYDERLLKEYVHNYLKDGTGSSWGVWIVYAMQKWANQQ